MVGSSVIRIQEYPIAIYSCIVINLLQFELCDFIFIKRYVEVRRPCESAIFIVLARNRKLNTLIGQHTIVTHKGLFYPDTRWQWDRHYKSIGLFPINIGSKCQSIIPGRRSIPTLLWVVFSSQVRIGNCEPSDAQLHISTLPGVMREKSSNPKAAKSLNPSWFPV